MARTTGTLIAAAWLLAANQVVAGPIASAGDAGAASSELASIGGLLQALGAGVIGNGALLYPTAASSHQREEAEILASDTVTRVFKKVKSILKEGGLNEDENGEDESKSITYLIKPAMIFHKEELPPPNPLAGNVLPLPGGALMYTPSPTGNSEPTSGPAASIKAAYGNLFAASPYFPSYTLNKPHAAVIVEEITDLISLKSVQQRLGDAGEDEEDSDEDEDEYGRKRKGKKSMKFVSLETIDSSSTFINPFTRADFPFGIITPQAAPTPTSEHKNSRKTVKKILSSKNPSSSDQIRASMGKDGGITVVNNAPVPATPTQGTTIIIPAASLQTSSPSAQSSNSAASSSHSEAPASSSSSAHEESSASHEESKNDDLHANEVTRLAHGHKATASKSHTEAATHAKGLHRIAASSFDPLATEAAPADAMSTLEMLASETAVHGLASPTVTVGSTPVPETHADSTQTDGPVRRKMRIVRVYEVKKNKSTTITIATQSTVHVMNKRDIMPIYDATDAALAGVPQPTPMLLGALQALDAAARVSNMERIQKEEDSDAEDDVDMDDASDGAMSAASGEQASSSASPASAEPSSASVESAAASSSSVSAESASSPASAASSSASAASSSASASASAASSSASASVASSSASASAASSTTSARALTDAKKDGTSTAEADAAPETTSGAKEMTLRNTSSKPLSIETIGVANTALDAAADNREDAIPAIATPTASAESSTTANKAAKSAESDSDKDDDSDSDSDSDDESATGKEVNRDSDGESDDDDDDDEGKGKGKKAKGDDDDDEDTKPKPKAKSRMALVTGDSADSMAGIQRMAALGLREAEKAILEFEQNSDAGDIEVLATEDAKPAMTENDAKPMTESDAKPMTENDAKPDLDASTSAILSPVDTEPATASNIERAAKPTRAPRADADADDDDDSDDSDDDDDSKSAKNPRRNKDAESDDDSDDDSDSDDDDDDKEKSRKPRATKSTKVSKKASKETGAKADVDVASDAGNDSDKDVKGVSRSNNHASKKQAKPTAATKQGDDDDDDDIEDRKALSEAASESAKQVVEIEPTHVESAASASEGEFHHGSGFERGFLTSHTASGEAASDEAASDEAASDHVASGASEDDYEIETDAVLNSGGEEVEFITQLVSDDFSKKAKVAESPSVVVMASIDEEYEEEYFSNSHSSEAKSTAKSTTFAKETTTGLHAQVQRNAMANDDEDGPDENLVRGVEPTPDVTALKESQNRAMNIGLGNLRRHV